MISLHRQLLLAWAILLPMVAGCGGGPTPVGVAGTVTLDGNPLPSGRIQFEPLAEVEGQRRDVVIGDGKFALPTEQGVLPGMEFKVIIKAFKKTGKKYPNADPGLSYDEEVQYLPEMYNATSTLRAAISANEDENKLSFELVSTSP